MTEIFILLLVLIIVVIQLLNDPLPAFILSQTTLSSSHLTMRSLRGTHTLTTFLDVRSIYLVSLVSRLPPMILVHILVVVLELLFIDPLQFSLIEFYGEARYHLRLRILLDSHHGAVCLCGWSISFKILIFLSCRRMTEFFFMIIPAAVILHLLSWLIGPLGKHISTTCFLPLLLLLGYLLHICWLILIEHLTVIVGIKLIIYGGNGETRYVF